MTTLTGKPLAPTEEWFDGVHGTSEGANSTKRRRFWDVTAYSTYTIVDKRGGVIVQSAPIQGGYGVNKEVGKDANGSWEPFFIYVS